MSRRDRLAWLGVTLALGAILAALVTTGVRNRPAAPPEPVPLSATLPTTAPPSLVVETAARTAGDGSYQVTDSPIGQGVWTAPGGPRCNWTLRNNSGSLLMQGEGAVAQRVDLRAGLSFRAGNCGLWTLDVQ